MSYRYGDRKQIGLFPKCMDDYVSQDDPVRAYDAIVDSMDFDQLGIELNEDKIGNPQYDPKAMLKLLVYGYSYGWKSARKLERALHHNVSFMWLVGGLKPDFKTISESRRNNKNPLTKVLKQCARICMDLDLIEGNILFVDGSKFRANASIKNTWDKKKCERALEKIDERIESLLTECEATDEREEGLGSLIKMKEELKDENVLKSKIEKILEEIKAKGDKPHNTVDPECTRVNSVHGTNAGYNAQIVVDDKNGLIVNSDVVSENNDLNQFTNQIEQVNETLGKKCKTASADSGYSSTDDLEKIDDQKINVIVPSQRQVSKKKLKPFDKANFKYDKENNCYICPEGNVLRYSGFNKRKKHKDYLITDKFICRKCPNFGECTKSKSGRKIIRLRNEQLREKFESQYNEPESQEIYKRRMQKVELPFGHFKRNLKVSAFRLKGIEGTKAEMSLLSSCFNISRMITIFGVTGLIEKLNS